MNVRVTVAVLVGVACVAHNGLANGYKILGLKSAKATAVGEAFVVRADDPSAVAFNPAGLAQLRGEQLNLQATLCNAYTEHTAPGGESTDMEDRWQTVPALFFTSDLGRDDLGVGLGISAPNGLSTEWDEESFARYVATYSDLVVVDISPALGVRIGESWLVGAGVNFYYSEAELRRMVDMGMLAGMPGQMDARSTLTGDGTAWGFNVGTIYHLNARHSVGLVYHHAYTVDYDGDVNLVGSDMPISAEIDFPTSVVVGYGYRPNEKWILEFNVDWTYWNDVDDIRVDFDTPGVPDSIMAQGFENTMAYKFGAEYACSDELALRCGYIYNENATPEENWRPSLPNTDTHFVTAGFGWTLDRLTLDGALQLIFYEDRTIDNNVDNNELTSSSSVDGKYETFAPCFTLAATYAF